MTASTVKRDGQGRHYRFRGRKAEIPADRAIRSLSSPVEKKSDRSFCFSFFVEEAEPTALPPRLEFFEHRAGEVRPIAGFLYVAAVDLQKYSGLDSRPQANRTDSHHSRVLEQPGRNLVDPQRRRENISRPSPAVQSSRPRAQDSPRLHSVAVVKRRAPGVCPSLRRNRGARSKDSLLVRGAQAIQGIIRRPDAAGSGDTLQGRTNEPPRKNALASSPLRGLWVECRASNSLKVLCSLCGESEERAIPSWWVRRQQARIFGGKQ